MPDANVKDAEDREGVAVTEEGNQVLVGMRLYVATEEGAERSCPVRRGERRVRESSAEVAQVGKMKGGAGTQACTRLARRDKEAESGSAETGTENGQEGLSRSARRKA